MTVICAPRRSNAISSLLWENSQPTLGACDRFVTRRRKFTASNWSKTGGQVSILITYPRCPWRLRMWTVSDWTPAPSPSIFHSTVADVSFDSGFIFSFGKGGFFTLPPLRMRAQ